MKEQTRLRIVIEGANSHAIRQAVLDLAESYNNEAAQVGYGEPALGHVRDQLRKMKENHEKKTVIIGKNDDGVITLDNETTSHGISMRPSEPTPLNGSMTPPSLDRYHDAVRESAQTGSGVVQVVTTNAEYDSDGYPYDERIHSAGKSVNKDGTWRYKKGIEKDLIKQVEATLPRKTNVHASATVTLPQAVNPQQTSLPPAQPFQMQAMAAMQQPVQSPLHQIPVAAPTPVQPEVVPNAFDLASFTKHFPTIVARLTSEGKITRDYVLAIEKYYGLQQLMDILKPAQAQNLNGLFLDWAQHGLITRVG